MICAYLWYVSGTVQDDSSPLRFDAAGREGVAREEVHARLGQLHVECGGRAAGARQRRPRHSAGALVTPLS